jgi:hypothetical protein
VRKVWKTDQVWGTTRSAITERSGLSLRGNSQREKTGFYYFTLVRVVRFHSSTKTDRERPSYGQSWLSSSRAFRRGPRRPHASKLPACSKKFTRNCVVGATAQRQVPNSLLQLFDVKPDFGRIMPCHDDLIELFGLGGVHSETFSPTRQSDSAARARLREPVNRECNTAPPRRVLEYRFENI